MVVGEEWKSRFGHEDLMLEDKLGNLTTAQKPRDRVMVPAGKVWPGGRWREAGLESCRSMLVTRRETLRATAS